ncbi:MAG: Rieske 2Fe-2S domain-containing protein [Ilumatobacteraceae bacterium]
MDADYLARFRERSAEESARTGPPPEFPALPDLPLGRYTDPEFFALERDHLWRKVWLYAAHETELEGAGAFKNVEVLGAPVVLVRNEAGEVHAFMNACRHRGAPVVRGPQGHARLLVCQYHSWTYDLDGILKRVPDERDFAGLCKEDRALVRVRCERWGGWYFVSLDPDAMPLAEFLDPLPHCCPRWRRPDSGCSTTEPCARCNWKVLAGRSWRCTTRTVHPTTVAPTVDTKGTVITLYDHGHQSMLSPVIPGTRNDDREALPMWEGVTPVFTDGIQPAHGIFPNIISPLDARGFPFLVFWPVDVRTTRLEITWFATDWGGGEHPRWDIWKKRLERFDVLMDEDYLNLEPIQRSIEAAAHGGQVINYQERRIWHVHAWIDKWIGADRIPEQLRVADALGHLIQAV